MTDFKIKKEKQLRKFSEKLVHAYKPLVKH